MTSPATDIQKRPSRLRPAGLSPSQVVIWLVLAVIVLANLCPFIWVVLSSFKPGSEINAERPTLLPRKWTLENYRNMAHQMGGFGRFYLNSFIVTTTTVGLTLLVG